MNITSEKKYKLLLIDDDKMDRMVFQRHIKKSKIKFDIFECAGGQSGLHEFQKNQFDCVFLDYGLPGTDGFQVLEKVLLTDPSASIVMLTGMGDESLAVKCIKAGATDYIPKDSLSPEILLRCLQALDLKKAKETAEKDSRAKSEFLSRMSHELRTPMNAILGFAQLMSGSKKEPLSPSHKKRAEQILIAGEHLLTLLNDVLDLTCIESGNIPISIEPVCVAEVVNNVLTEVQPLAEKQNIQLINETSATSDLLVDTDRTRIKQVLLNIISNGIKYNRENGKVILSYERVNNDILQINIKDTGIGIPEDKLDRLFEPFDRLGSENSEIEGVGIGLTISKKLVSLMHGTLGVQSVFNEGSHFYIRLPLASKSKIVVKKNTTKNTNENFEEINSKKNFRMLYVEDNSANLELVKDIFSEYSNFQVLSAPNGRKGVELAETAQPDLILMDINMPEMNGLEAVEHLKNCEKTQHIPVIALSANAMQKDIDRAMAAGFKDYITKPINISKLKNTIDTFCNP
ncbi:MAG: CheY-like chemotaxis protein [Nitrospinales bacterium]|jgi:CheY-like chemotaxis protein